MKSARQQSGFTLIEILVAISMMTIITSVGVSRYSGFNNRQKLISLAQTFKNNLRDTQQKAQSGVKPDVDSCASPNTLDYYRVNLPQSDTYRIQAYCSGGASGIRTDHTLPSPFTFRRLEQINFLGLGQGASVQANGSQIILQNNATQQTSTAWYALCVSESGAIKDCGYTQTYSVANNCNCGN